MREVRRLPPGAAEDAAVALQQHVEILDQRLDIGGVGSADPVVPAADHDDRGLQ